MTFGSLFSGIGGMDLGLEQAGWTCAWQCEIDPWRRSILSKHWPEVPKHEDVHDLPLHALRPVELIAAGFPCQPFSQAGQRRGAIDGRNLWPVTCLVVGHQHPPFVLLENVPGIRRYLRVVRDDLRGMGYCVAPPIYPTAACLGAGLRRRVFVLAHANEDELRLESWRRLGEKWAEMAAEPPHFAGWNTEPEMDRLADGLPDDLAGLAALGDSVTPPMARWIGELLLEACQ